MIYSLHGPSPGHEPGGSRQHSASRRDAAPFPRRSPHPRRRIGVVRTNSADPRLARKGRRRTPRSAPATAEEPAERIWKETTAVPRVHFYGNGRYSLMVTNSGGGYSRWNDFDLSRWRSDTTLDPWGSFLYIRDMRSDALWAAAPKPVGGNLGTSFRALLRRSRRVPPQRLRHRNGNGGDGGPRRRRRIAPRHRHQSLACAPGPWNSPATANWRWLRTPPTRRIPLSPRCSSKPSGPRTTFCIAHRRPRSPDEPPVWAAHFLVGATGKHSIRNRSRKISSARQHRRVRRALRRPLSGSTGIVLDPIFSLRCRATLEPLVAVEFVLVTLIANSREEILALAAKYRRRESVTRAFEMAWTRSQLEFRYLGIGPAKAHRFHELASNLLYPNPNLRLPAVRLQRNRLGQSALWGYGISGDLPMLTVIIGDARGSAAGSRALARAHLLAHARLPRRPDYSQSGKPQLRSAPAPPAAAPDRCPFAKAGDRSAGRRLSARLACDARRSPRPAAGRLPRGSERQPRFAPAATGDRRKESGATRIRPLRQRRGRAFRPAAISRTAVLQRPGRLHQGRPRIRHLSQPRQPRLPRPGSTSWPMRISARW